MKITVQLLLAGIVMPLKLKAVAPALSIAGVVPAHVPPTAPPTATILTSMSVKLAPVSADAFGLVSVSVTAEAPPDWIAVGVNAFAMVGAVSTVRLAVLLAAPAVGV